jgi:hypothetical protein
MRVFFSRGVDNALALILTPRLGGARDASPPEWASVSRHLVVLYRDRPAGASLSSEPVNLAGSRLGVAELLFDKLI